ncbi:MAG: ABC transporter permease, partial [Bacteroidales bacterium]|nr:ABC transporter permease [Bacteroidales bacterium]
VQFMVGKITGIGSVGLLQFVLWILLTFGLVWSAQLILFPEPYVPSQLPEMAETLGATTVSGQVIVPESVSVSYAVDLLQTLEGVNWLVMLSAFVFFFIFGYLLYAALFAGIGAMSDQDTETQQFIIPVTLPLFLPIILLPLIISNPNGSLAVWLSMIPFTSPIAMMARLPFGVAYWQVALSAGILFATCLILILLSARLYRSGMLLYGQKLTLRSFFSVLKKAQL